MNLPWSRINELANSLAGFLPAGAEALSEDFKKNLRAFLNTTLARMDLVTLEALEKQVARLEAELLKQASPPP
jgi:BMFP domain-containing protein YqiC